MHSVILFLILAFLFVVLGFAEEVNPYPRPMMVGEKLHAWTFERDTGGWKALNQCSLEAADGLLKIHSTGGDPYLAVPVKPGPGGLALKLRIRCQTSGDGEIFWAVEQANHFAPERSQTFHLAHDNQWHDCTALIGGPQDTITQIRLDPGTAEGLIEVQSIDLCRGGLHPLELVRVETQAAQLNLTLRNHGTVPIVGRLSGQPFDVPAGKDATVALPAPGPAAVEALTLEVEPVGLGAFRRTIFLFHPEAKTESVTRRAGDLLLSVARDGSCARLERGGMLLAALAPIVAVDSKVPSLALAEGGEAGPVRLAGTGLKAEFALSENELAVRIESDRPCEGPVVRALGALEQGVFAGLEYLDRGEWSSSTLDIETPEHLRFAPDVDLVTLPLMACVTDRGSVAVTWKDMGLQPVFASPNFLDGAPDQRMALRGKTIEATILAAPPAPITQAILWAVRKRGLPPIPEAPCSREAQTALCLKSLHGPLKDENGWGHCAEPNWKRQYFADHASTIFRLSGEVLALPRLVPGGAHVRNDAIYFLTGRAQEWLQMQRGRVKGLLKEQGPDGSFHYKGQYRRGHYEDTASGFCAQKAMELLECAFLTGDAEARDAGVKALEYMKRFQAPRGAQTWELSLHTPDILASAYLVWAYVRGYELTGKKEYLDLARDWALSGVPFVYLWGRHPTMCYATIAVFGATNWRAPNWMGLPVQWCGSVYAYALALLAPHEKTLDWKQLAQGILVTAQRMQHPDGAKVGCLPDFFWLKTQQRDGPSINPCALISLQWRLEGRVDSLAVAADAQHRVAAPFPVKLDGKQAVIQGQAGLTYQVLVDGRAVEVRSQGEDKVPVE